jgi:hypothetical protein
MIPPELRSSTRSGLLALPPGRGWTTAPEGTVLIPGDHARVSIWLVDRPVAAISVTQSDAEALGRFLLDPQPTSWPSADTATATR